MPANACNGSKQAKDNIKAAAVLAEALIIRRVLYSGGDNYIQRNNVTQPSCR